MTDLTEERPLSRPREAPGPYNSGRLALWGSAVLLALVAGQVYGFLESPPDRDMGNLQKIMYVHVPAAWSAMIAFLLVFARAIQ